MQRTKKVAPIDKRQGTLSLSRRDTPVNSHRILQLPVPSFRYLLIGPLLSGITESTQREPCNLPKRASNTMSAVAVPTTTSQQDASNYCTPTGCSDDYKDSYPSPSPTLLLVGQPPSPPCCRKNMKYIEGAGSCASFLPMTTKSCSTSTDTRRFHLQPRTSNSF